MTPTARYQLFLVPDTEPVLDSAWQPTTHAPAPATLTRREVEVIERMSNGLSNRAIAADLVVTEKTVKNHINHIFFKLGVRERVTAVLAWQRLSRDPAVAGRGLGPSPHGGA